MTYADGLEGKHLDLVEYPGSPLHVLAGPGTGKSLVLKRRVARLIAEGESPDSILAVTFTRTAANDILNDLNDLNLETSGKVYASTLHSLCFSILMKEDVLTVTGRVPRPLMDFERRMLILDLSEEFGGIRDKERRLKAFESAWARLQSEEPGWPTEPIDQKFQTELLSWLVFHRAILVGELVPETLRYLKNNPTAPERKLYKHVFGDEYQDFNKAEQELFKFLAETPLTAGGSLTVVGDENQSIYSFKYAYPEGIIRFPIDFPETYSDSLDECRRCPVTVVRMANAFLQQGSGGGEVRLLTEFSANGPGEVRIVQWGALDDEIRGLASFVASRIQKNDVEPGEVLVLTPRRFIGYRIRDLLNEANIPVRSCFFEEALESPFAKERFALLTLLARPDDRPSLRALLGLPSTTGLKGGYRVLRAHCEASGESPWQTLVRLESGDLTLSHMGPLKERFQWIKQTLEPLTGC